MSQVLKDKLIEIHELLKSCNGKKFSTLTIEEKRAVELLCARVLVDEKGKKTKEGKFVTLAISPAAAWAGKAILGGENFVQSAPTTFHIIEDEQLKWKELDVNQTQLESSNIFNDAILTFPNNYHAIRRYKGKNVDEAYWGRGNNCKEHGLKNFMQSEIEYGLYPNWVSPTKEIKYKTPTADVIRVLITPLHFYTNNLVPLTPALAALLTKGYIVKDNGLVNRTDECIELYKKLDLYGSDIFTPRVEEQHILAAKRLYSTLGYSTDASVAKTPLVRDIILADQGLRFNNEE